MENGASRGLRYTAAVLALVLVTLTAQSPDAGLDPLVALLAKAGASEAKKGPCTFFEDSVVEGLDEKGKLEGKIVRRFETTVKDAMVTDRTLVSKKVEGNPSSQLTKEQEPAKEPQLSAFHPKKQEEFVFRIDGPTDGERVKVRFGPKDDDPKRLKGFALIDPNTGLVAHLEGEPSKLPMFLDQFHFAMDQAETACGPHITKANIKGKGGLLFLRVEFRAETAFTGQKLP